VVSENFAEFAFDGRGGAAASTTGEASGTPAQITIGKMAAVTIYQKGALLCGWRMGQEGHRTTESPVLRSSTNENRIYVNHYALHRSGGQHYLLLMRVGCD